MSARSRSAMRGAALGTGVTPTLVRRARVSASNGRRRRIAPGSLEDRILEVIPPAPVHIDMIVAAGRARREDVIAALQQLRRDNVVRMAGRRRGARYVRA